MIERTTDKRIIKRIITDNAIYPYVSDDGSPKKEDFDIIENDNVYYLLVRNNDKIYGLYFVHAMNYITYEIHTCLLPSSRGKIANNAAKDVLKWLVDNTKCLKVITHVPEHNKTALSYARRAGLVVEGVNRKSFLKEGMIYDQILLGITRIEICQQQQQ